MSLNVPLKNKTKQNNTAFLKLFQKDKKNEEIIDFNFTKMSQQIKIINFKDNISHELEYMRQKQRKLDHKST